MNLIVLEPADFVGPDRVRLHDRRLTHARKYLKVAVGDRLRVGLVDEPDDEPDEGQRGQGSSPAPKLGHGEVLRCDQDALELRIELGTRPPPPSQLVLAVALPRPPTLAKVLQQGTALGVKRFLLFHSRRVEKTYWQASAMAAAQIRRQLLLGLEQCVDTVVPRVELHPRFRPFVEDRLAVARARGPVFVGHPSGELVGPRGIAGSATVVVGPEGGFVDFERARFEALGDRFVSLGPRVLRVETAVVALLARLGP